MEALALQGRGGSWGAGCVRGVQPPKHHPATAPTLGHCMHPPAVTYSRHRHHARPYVWSTCSMVSWSVCGPGFGVAGGGVAVVEGYTWEGVIFPTVTHPS